MPLRHAHTTPAHCHTPPRHRWRFWTLLRSATWCGHGLALRALPFSPRSRLHRLPRTSYTPPSLPYFRCRGRGAGRTFADHAPVYSPPPPNHLLTFRPPTACQRQANVDAHAAWRTTCRTRGGRHLFPAGSPHSQCCTGACHGTTPRRGSAWSPGTRPLPVQRLPRRFGVSTTHEPAPAFSFTLPVFPPCATAALRARTGRTVQALHLPPRYLPAPPVLDYGTLPTLPAACAVVPPHTLPCLTVHTCLPPLPVHCAFYQQRGGLDVLLTTPTTPTCRSHHPHGTPHTLYFRRYSRWLDGYAVSDATWTPGPSLPTYGHSGWSGRFKTNVHPAPWRCLSSYRLDGS